MADLASLTADQLAETVQAVIAEPPENITVPDDEQAALAALAELQTRANHHGVVMVWKARAEAAEKERDEWQQLAYRLAEEAGVDAEAMLAQARVENKP